MSGGEVTAIPKAVAAMALGIITAYGLIGCADTRPAKTSNAPFAGIVITLQDFGWAGVTIEENFAKEAQSTHDLISDVKPYLANKPTKRVVAKNLSRCSVMITGPGGRTEIRCGEPPWDLRTTVNRAGHYQIDLVDQGDVVSLSEIDVVATGIYQVTLKLTGESARRFVDFTPY